MRKVEIYIDGASKGNPGPAGVGVIIYEGDKVLKNISNYIGRATNNFAEYSALICALKEAININADAVMINTDSQLLSRQINREYRVKNANILELYKKVVELMASFKEISINHIPREKNIYADRLATQAVKEAMKISPL